MATTLPIAAPIAAQANEDEFAVPGCLDSANNDYRACQTRARNMAAAGVEARDARRMADAWRIVCVFKDQESCREAARIYTEGGAGLEPDLRIAANFHANACEYGAKDDCAAALAWFSRPGANKRDIRRLAYLHADQCKQGDVQACEVGAFIVADGFGDRFVGVGDIAVSLQMAETGCNSGKSPNSCILAEALTGDGSLAVANEDTALRYARINCDGGIDSSCLRLGADAQREGDWASAAIHYAASCKHGSRTGCRYAADAKAMRDRVAQEQARKAGFLQALEQGDYAAATYAAIRVHGSKEYLGEAIRYIARKGRMGAVPTEDLYIVELWIPDGEAGSAAKRELRARGTGLEGSFGTGTNNAGQAAARWNAAYGNISSHSGTPSGGSSFTPKPMPSAADISKQTRQKYHWNNCVMSRIPNNPNC